MGLITKKSKFAIKKDTEKYILSEESAFLQVMSFLEFYDVDIEEIKDEKARNATESVLEKIVSFIRMEYISIEKIEGVPIVIQYIDGNKTDENKKLQYKQITGKAMEQTDGFGENDNNAKTHALLGSLSSVGKAGIEQLSGKNLSAAQCLSALFLSI